MTGRLMTSDLGNGPLTLRNVVILAVSLVAAKLVVFTALYVVAHGQIPTTEVIYPLPKGVTATLHSLSTDWDGLQYQVIARYGYPSWKGSESYAFSPVYPALIYLTGFLTGSYWTAALVVTNLLAFVFPVIVLRMFDLRTALLAELFPVYVVYSMLGYSDVLALIFLSLALLCYIRGRYLLTGVSVALAGLVLYDLLIAVAAFALYLIFQLRGTTRARELRRALTSVVVPVAAMGAAILIGYEVATGDPFTFFHLERAYWDAGLTTPVGQIEWLYHGAGPGSFTNMIWIVYGVSITSTYWAVRNVIFEAFVFFGVYLLATLRGCPQRWLLVAYSLVFSVPFLFIQGTPVYSIPRLMLAAYPIFFGYSQRIFTRNLRVLVYVGVALAAGCWVLMTFAYAFFA